MRSHNIENRYRFVLGPEAVALVKRHCPPDEEPKAAHLDAAIAAISAELSAREDALKAQQADLVAERELRADLDRRLTEIIQDNRTGLRGLMMAIGEIIKELDVIRQVLEFTATKANEQAERLLLGAIAPVMKLRSLLGVWRARHNMELPKFDRAEEAWTQAQLIVESRSPANDPPLALSERSPQGLRTDFRGLLMMLGQTIRELHILRHVIIVAAAADEEEADRLLNNAKPAVLELVSTLAAWRAREAIELPEFERVKDDWALERLIQNPETLRNLGQGETLGEALAEQFQRFKESFDPTLTEERMEREGRELEIGDED
ncbi:hypothetical protein [Methylobacterium sp.]|uniref:hypothetical protein n=1 Tax=Methylobacterium sp. TaxID=409 RepID=UPI003C78BE8A